MTTERNCNENFTTNEKNTGKLDRINWNSSYAKIDLWQTFYDMSEKKFVCLIGELGLSLFFNLNFVGFELRFYLYNIYFRTT